jgi:pantoate--beta-alanine ligase
MEVFQDILSTRTAINSIRQSSKSIGLIPTMGALHEGHLSLIRASKGENDITIVTIFVNPIQFNNPEDLENYPSNYESDLAALEEIGCDIVFAPSTKEMYLQAPTIKLSFGELENIMEGAFRPGHFSGVALVVMKLFNILQPKHAYFGQKDIQQYKIIEKMVSDTSLAVNLKMMPVIRENSGLALSSRNSRLSISGKQVAPQIFKALLLFKDKIIRGGSIKDSVIAAEKQLSQYPEINVEYLTLVNLKDLQVVESSNETNPLVLCFAGYINGVRLIDNIIIKK